MLVLGTGLSQYACEKVINLPLKEAGERLVIEGNINNFYSEQVVRISKTTSFDYVGEPIPVTDAIVTIRENNEAAKVLREDKPGYYVLSRLKGIPGNTYHLSVKIGDQVYEATSTMPNPVFPDSVGTVSSSVLKEVIKSAAVVYSDPEDERNYYRFKIKLNDQWTKSFWIYNDRFSNGKVVTQTLTDFDNKLKYGDLVVLQMQCVDSLMYNYWFSLKGQNPGAAAPANPVSNLTNGALGYFSANSVSYTQFEVR